MRDGPHFGHDQWTDGMSFVRYPEYKDSGVEWLGEVPVHWEIDRLKRSTISAKNGIWGDEAQQDANDIPCVRVADFDRQGLRVQLSEPTIRNVINKERVGRVLVQGDLLLEKSGGGEGQPVGCVVLYDDSLPAVCSNFVARVQTAPDMDSSFWRYVHAAAYAVRLNTRSIKQTSGIQNLDASQYFDESAGFPPQPEQTQIAAFLDRETAKIDALVAEQRQLMALLKEKRQAVVSHAVTRGLNPDAPMKLSGIEWLGDVPAHWEVKRIKFVTANVKAGPFGSALTKDVYVSAGYRIYGQEQVIPNNFSIGDYFITPEKYGELSQYSVSPGDILISCVGTFGKIAIVPDTIEPGIINPRLIRLRCSQAVKAEYLVEVMRSNVTFEQFSSFTRGGTMDVINIGTLNEIFVALPPMKEQQELLIFVQHEIGKFDTLTAETQRAIDLLQERRTALISAAVTGQIDVRSAVVSALLHPQTADNKRAQDYHP